MPRPGKPVRLHPEARAELQESVNFCRNRGGELWADRFKQRVADGLNIIASKPEGHVTEPGLAGVQKLRLKQFPFSLIFANRHDYVWVAGISCITVATRGCFLFG
jgi:plasmid stabilization system protein ParE